MDPVVAVVVILVELELEDPGDVDDELWSNLNVGAENRRIGDAEGEG